MKKTVHYVKDPNDEIVEGRRATLFHVVDHPNLAPGDREGRMVYTSLVVRIHEGYFETENSYYIPI